MDPTDRDSRGPATLGWGACRIEDGPTFPTAPIHATLPRSAAHRTERTILERRTRH